MKQDDIYEILDRAYDSEDVEEIAALAERALSLDPDNPEALLLKADITEEDDERLAFLEKALDAARKYFQKEGLSGEDILEDDMGPVYLGLLQRMAYTLFFLERDDHALELVEELLSYDHEDLAMAKTLYYRILLEREEWSRVLEETMRETVRGLGWAYARVMATFMLSRDKSGKSHAAAGGEQLSRMLWDAVRMAPNVPFYMLGYIPDPVDKSEDEEFHFGILFENVWPASSQDLLNWFSKATIILGLLTGRFGSESGDMREILAALGGEPELEELERRLAGSPRGDAAVLAVLTEGNYPQTGKQ
jgi:tetratricopeptide (TPR) repeat protein